MDAAKDAVRAMLANPALKYRLCAMRADFRRELDAELNSASRGEAPSNSTAGARDWVAVVDEQVPKLLDEPPIVTAGDLRRSMGRMSDCDWDNERLLHQEYDRQARRVLTKIRLRQAEPFVAAICSTTPTPALLQRQFWTNGRASLTVSGIGRSNSQRLHFVEPAVLYVQASGWFSQQALSAFRAVSRRVVRSTLRSCADEAIAAIPVVSSDGIDEDLRFSGACLDAAFERPTNARRMRNRLRNAVLLVAEADCQAHAAVRLALCFSAIEALLGEDKPGVTETVASRLSAALEGDASSRPSAKAYIKKLYRIRSEVLHGSALEHDVASSVVCREMAGALLTFVVKRTETLIRESGGVPERPADLYRDLDEAAATGADVPMASRSPVDWPWRREQ